MSAIQNIDPTHIQSAATADALAPTPDERELLDKKVFHTRVEREFVEAQASGKPLAVLFIDADHFKDVNDVLGHDVGDAVINDTRGLIGVIVSSLRTLNNPSHHETASRPLDVVAVGSLEPTNQTISQKHEMIEAEGGHIGGDEFAVLLPNTDAEGAKIVVGRLREAIREYVNLPGNEALRELGLDASIGVGVLDDATRDTIKTAGDLLRVADEDMYRDKLEKLPELTEKQLRSLKMAEFILKSEGIRLRDFAKYLRLHNSQT
ncbi:MAG: diguanylate cyclase [Candidatus Saccharibacteria bacterium]|nr:diguanylate cyclase [Candidatus Saccharibacteria bacterium]